MENLNKIVKREEGSVFSTDENYSRALSVAKNLASSDLVPQTYKGKPSNCLIALDVARQVNSSPLIVMQNLNIILGKPSWSSTYIAGAIKSRYKNISVILDGTGDDRGCKVVAYDDANNIIAEGVRVNIKMAKAEGWMDKKGSKWKTMPDLMLQYRANSFFGRVHCPDVLIGLQSEYEIIDVAVKVEDKKVADPFADKEEKTEDATIVKNDELEKIEAPSPEEAEEVTEVPEENTGCESCGDQVTDKVRKYSQEKLGKILCFTCQKKG